MEDCVFCKILRGEIPSTKVYEDDNVYAFLDIAPTNPGHTLVIPKEHFSDMEDVSEEALCDVIKGVKKVGNAIKEGMGVKGYNIMLNNGSIAGQVVPHIHFHIVPRYDNDGLVSWRHSKYERDEEQEVLNKIKNAL